MIPASDTTIRLDNLPSIAHCFALTATDSVGNEDYNQVLSERRAGKVVNVLQQKCGWAPYRMLTPTGMAEADPAADNSTAAGKAQNRRVTVNILVSKAVDGIEQVHQQRGPHPHPIAGLAEIHGAWIGVDVWYLVIMLQSELDIFFLSLAADHPHRSVNWIDRVDALQADGHLASLNLGHVENVIDHIQQVLARSENVFCVAFIAFVAKFAVKLIGEDFREAVNCV